METEKQSLRGNYNYKFGGVIEESSRYEELKNKFKR